MDPPGDSSIFSGKTFFDSGVIGMNQYPRPDPVMSELFFGGAGRSRYSFPSSRVSFKVFPFGR